MRPLREPHLAKVYIHKLPIHRIYAAVCYMGLTRLPVLLQPSEAVLRPSGGRCGIGPRLVRTRFYQKCKESVPWASPGFWRARVGAWVSRGP